MPNVLERGSPVNAAASPVKGAASPRDVPTSAHIGYGLGALKLALHQPPDNLQLAKYEGDGRERWMGLGALHAFDLMEARERARKARQLLAEGIDPITHRNKAAEALAMEAAKDKPSPEVADACLMRMFR